MQVNNFIQYLDDTAQLKSVTADEMLPIIREFPYCQTGQLMYTIQLNENNSILFEEQLKKTASICSDRNKLFEYIHQTEELVVVEKRIEISESKDAVDPVIEKEEPLIEVEKKEKEKKAVNDINETTINELIKGIKAKGILVEVRRGEFRMLCTSLKAVVSEKLVTFYYNNGPDKISFFDHIINVLQQNKKDTQK